MALSGLPWWPIVWGQATGSGPNALAPLALRRWCSSLTLSSPEAVPSLFGLRTWLLGLGALLVLAMALQGPGRALRQLFDASGHVGLLASGLDRLRRAGRMVSLTIGATVLSWTASQAVGFNDPRARDDLYLLLKARSLGELSLEQGVLAALTPLRDVFALGDNLPMLLLATGLLFRALTDHAEWPRVGPTGARRSVSPTGWANLIWGATALYALYRIGSRVAGTGGMPLGSCLPVEVAFVPVLMVLCDGALLAWVLVELRSMSLGDVGDEVLDPRAVVGLWPGAVLACLLAMPGRYLAAAGWIFLPALARPSPLGGLVRWQLGAGLTVVQGAALAAAGLAGAVTWGRGAPSGALRGYSRMIAVEGGHLVALLAIAGLAAGSASALSYLLVLSLPISTWALAAADGYSHYATLPVGLLAVAAMVELGERSLPIADLAADDASRPVTAGIARDEPAA